MYIYIRKHAKNSFLFPEITISIRLHSLGEPNLVNNYYILFVVYATYNLYIDFYSFSIKSIGLTHFLNMIIWKCGLEIQGKGQRCNQR